MKCKRIKYILHALLLLIVAIVLPSTFVQHSSTADTTVESYESNQIIVTYKKEPVTNEEYYTLSKESGVSVEPITDTSLLVTTSTKEKLREKLHEYSTDPNVAFYQPNYTYQVLDGTSEPDYSKQWWAYNDGTFLYNSYLDTPYNTSDIRLSKYQTFSTPGIDTDIVPAWSLFNNGRSILVAIVDTGIDYSHPDLTDHIYTNTVEIPNDGIDNDKNGYIDDVNGWNFYEQNNNPADYTTSSADNDHGTHCAGIIGASVNDTGIAGIASNTNVSILPVKVLGGSKGQGNTLDIVKGIQYAEQMGAQICNLSLGTEYDSSYNYEDTLLAQTIKNSSMMFVIACGNGGKDSKGDDNDITPTYPASLDYDNIISVANITCAGDLHTSSNYGVKSVDLAAPGTCIYSTIANGKYAYASGTSMSAPMVTAGLAEIYSYYPNLTMRQCAKILLSSVKTLPCLSQKVSTGGILDIYGALTYDVSTVIPELNAPVITYKQSTVSKSYKQNLNLTITDIDGNLSTVCYAIGTQSTEYFNNGKNGTVLDVKNNLATISNIATTTTYTIYANDCYGNETVTVVPVTVKAPTKLTLSVKKKSIKVGKSYTLKATPNVTCTIKFTSSNKSIAKVTSSGKITGKKKGTCTITATTENGIKASCKIKIIK